jgi:hypothetical protein
MSCAVLTYHSHNVFGGTYDRNDHIAFQADLDALTEWGIEIISLYEVAQRLMNGSLGHGRYVGLSFDDGPIFDVDDFTHPTLGFQPGFGRIMASFAESKLGARQPKLHATSFVIASPEARVTMERAEQCGYTWIPGWLRDDWWAQAGESRIEIANHSWDHAHGSLARTAITSSDERDNFAIVKQYVDADREIRVASDFIRRLTGQCRLFAFPFGHFNEYLVNEYLPERQMEHGCVAAFSAEGRLVEESDSIWKIPRLICGHHWKNLDQLKAILFEAPIQR